MVFNSNNYADYTERIQFLRSFGDYLLQKIQLSETNLNKGKQQNQQPLDSEIKELHGMIIKLLQSLAEINVCQYFHSINEYYYHNDFYYQQMCRRYFQDLMQQFSFSLNQIKKHYLNQDDDDDDDIDFSIS